MPNDPIILSIQEKNRYTDRIVLDDDRFFKLNKKIVYRLHLQVGEPVKDWEGLVESFLTPAIKNRLKDLLMKKDYSEQELYRKLRDSGYCEELVFPAIEEFKARGFIDDYRYCESLVEAWQNRYGILKIRQKAYEKGISSDILEEVLENLIPPEESSIFRHLEKVDADSLRNDFSYRNKIIRRLSGKGYRYEEIKEAIEKIIHE